MLPELSKYEVENSWQRAYLDSFIEKGWPSSKNEEWKFTSLSGLFEKPFVLASKPEGDTRVNNGITGEEVHRIVFRNGIFDAKLSDDGSSHVVVSNLFDDDEALQSLNQYQLNHHPIFNLTLGVMKTAVLIDVSVAPADKTPFIELSFTGGLFQQSAHPVIMIRVAEEARVNISETHSSNNCLSAPITVIELANGATCDHLKCQVDELSCSHIGLNLVNQKSTSDYHYFSLSSGGNISRSETHLNLDGENASCYLSSIYLGCKDQHMDVTTRLYHNVANCKSEQIIRGVLDDRARGVFQGKIRVAPNAQNTDGQQMTRALLLSRETEADTKPELEIFADDVVCSHGATIGEIDEHQLFYLVSRGIPFMKARSMLIRAFLVDTLSQIRVPQLEKQAELHLHKWVSTSNQLTSKTA